jgi:chromosomal replication initiation ATPase DnaA
MSDRGNNLGDIASFLGDMASQLNTAAELLTNPIQQDYDPRVAASLALEIIISVSAELKCSIRRIKTAPGRITDIQKTVANHFGIPLIEMTSSRRASARPRHVAMAFARKMTGYSLEAIGASFGGKDHATVLYAVKRVERLVARDPEFARSVTDIRRELAA